MAKQKGGTITEEVRELISEVARATASMAYIDNAGGQINYFRAMESLLYNYKKLEALVADEEEYTTVEYHEGSKSLVKFSPSAGGVRKTRDDIIDEMERERAISFQRTRARFDEVDRVVRLFTDKKEFAVVRMYYFGEDVQGNKRNDGETSCTWEDVAYELAEAGILRDVKTARRWRNKVVNDMAVCLFGKPAAVSAGTYRIVHG